MPIALATRVVSGTATGLAGTAIVAITDSSGGTPGAAVPAIGATYVQADVANALASLAAKQNALVARVNGTG